MAYSKYPVDTPVPQPGKSVERRTITIDYTNSRGERSIRNIMPMQIFFGRNDFHNDGDQWFMEALDVDKKPAAVRHFAIKDIHRVLTIPSDSAKAIAAGEFTDLAPLGDGRRSPTVSNGDGQ